LAGGEYAYLGRTDSQIQVKGHRVELGELEAALRRQPTVVEAVAFGWPEREATAEALAAFVTDSNADPEVVRAAVRTLLPAFMVPTTIVVIEALPLNANGKVDPHALRKQLDESGPRE
jgi:acyl-coenzyme A synthetase/AMP-(fatty) acid ligase|tara:strand:+ start:260 stop:613 length:354 start_codon:yes stop_codon:yes gene_type:complete